MIAHVGRDKDFQSLKDPDSSTNFGLLTGSGSHPSLVQYTYGSIGNIAVLFQLLG